jgi:uncharacterized protein involved in response to NO
MKNSYFLSQPHQPFFVLAFVNAIFSMFLFMLLFKGTLTPIISANIFHAYTLIYMVLTPVFLAFLFTTFPKFSVTPPIEKVVYITILVPFVLASFLILLGITFSSTLIHMGMVVGLIGHLLAVNILRKIYVNTTINDKHDLFWILISMAFGGLSHLLFLIAYFADFPTLMTFSKQMAIYLYLFMIGFSVAQRMVPFFAHVTVEKDPMLLPNIAFLLAVHVILESIQPHLSFMADAFLLYLTGKHIVSWDLPFSTENPLISILLLALFWVPIAFLLSVLVNIIALIGDITFIYLDIHLLMLGFLLTLLIGFGTRVTIGHSGNAMVADKWTKGLFYWTQVVVISRIMTSLIASFGWNFLVWFDITIAVWLILFGVWASRFFEVLIFGKKLK